MLELLIGMILTAAVAAAALKFYQAHHELYLAQTDVADRQGNVRYAVEVIAKDVRNAGFLVPGSETLRISTNFDTLVVYMGDSAATSVDTVRYYVDRYQSPPALVIRRNTSYATPLAVGIDTVRFVPTGTPNIQSVSVVLVTVEQHQYDNSALKTRRRLGKTINLRNG